ncbi:MAG: hypothetical protein AAF799_00170 [Myxococcota bacterium]
MLHRLILTLSITLPLSACAEDSDSPEFEDEWRAAGDPDIFGAPDCDCPTCNVWAFNDPSLVIVARAEDLDPLSNLPGDLQLDLPVSRSSYVSVPLIEDFFSYGPGCYLGFADFADGDLHGPGGSVIPLDEMHPKEVDSIVVAVDKGERAWVRNNEQPTAVLMYRTHQL